MSSYFFGVDSGSVSTLFGSLSSSKSSSVNNMSFVSDYASIKNGSYAKLLKSYYKKSDSSSVSASDKTDSKDNTADKKEAVSVRDAAADLKKSAQELTSSKSDLFSKKTDTGTDGKKTTDYDKDAIYKAVSGFVDNYNKTLEAAKDSSNAIISRRTSGMKGVTSTYSKALESVGITASSDGKLSIDEKAFKNANMKTVETLFKNSGSYGASIGSEASSIVSAGNTQIAQLSGSLYNSTGSYGSGFYSGSFYSDYF